jgi:hypothetical protein
VAVALMLLYCGPTCQLEEEQFKTLSDVMGIGTVWPKDLGAASSKTRVRGHHSSNIS